MKFFIVLAALIGIAASQSRNSRCPRGPLDTRPSLFGHETDCQLFFRCFDGVALRLTCPTGRYWSPANLSCDSSNPIECRTPVRQMATFRPITNPPSRVEHNCPLFDNPDEFIYMPHRNNCRSFYQCQSGRAVEMECPPGFMFNLEGSFCDRQQNVQCITPRM